MIKDPKNPRYMNLDGSLIDLTVTHERLGEIQYTTTLNDSEERGRVLYAAALAGEFGPIAAYVPPVKTTQQIAEDARFEDIKSARSNLKQDQEIKNFAAQTKAELIADVASISSLPEAKRHIKRLSMLVWMMAKELQ